jgi:type III restriction enzyme
LVRLWCHCDWLKSAEAGPRSCAEVAGRHGTGDYLRRLEPENQLHNDGLPRVALKIVAGTGKIVVIAMIIA